MKTTIAVLGVGLIGGSLALSFRQDPECRLIGFDVKEENLDKALTRGVLHAATNDLATAVREADFIILAAPVEQIYWQLEQLSAQPLKPEAIVTDVGSIKRGIVEYANRVLPRHVTFIGGHPMAGSHKSGVEAANERLFENAYYVLTPGQQASTEQVERLARLLACTRAKVVLMDPDEHDRVVGAVSHFPHVLAAVLVNQVSKYNQTNEWHHRLAAGGFRDITRIASSNPRMWRDILLSNREHVLQIARDWRTELEHIISLIEAKDRDGIEAYFREAREFREGLPERQKGAMPALYDLYIDIPDHPGEIGRITTLLGAKQINITNIQILEEREDIFGVLRISFRNEAELEKGEELLRFFDYNVYRRD